MPDRGQKVSVIAQENLKLAIFYFIIGAVAGVSEDTLHLTMGQKKLEDKYKDLDVLLKINKSDMAGMIEAIKEYLRSCHGVVLALSAYIIRKTITLQTYDDYPMHANSEDEIIARLLHFPSDKNKVHNKQSAQSIT